MDWLTCLIKKNNNIIIVSLSPVIILIKLTPAFISLDQNVSNVHLRWQAVHVCMHYTNTNQYHCKQLGVHQAPKHRSHVIIPGGRSRTHDT